jgi:DMSO/TMAO reductase YedYZ molybdopterin-dependent catalytic subunit
MRRRRRARLAGPAEDAGLDVEGDGAIESTSAEPFMSRNWRWTDALLHQVLEQARPAAAGVEVRFTGADHGSYLLHPILQNIDASDLTFERSLTLAHAADPEAEILIAYEMNGGPLNRDRPLHVPVSRSSASNHHHPLRMRFVAGGTASMSGA